MPFNLVLVEVCDANQACRPELFSLESQFSSVDIMETNCMSECDLCAHNPYAFVNGELVEAEHPDTLVEKVKFRIREILEDSEPSL